MAMKQETKNDLYKQVTAALIEQMEQGIAVWQQPWVTSKAHQPHNGASGRAYNGFNRLYLGWLQEDMGTTDSRWYTYKGATEAGAQVRKGEKSTIVVYNSPVIKDEDTIEEVRFWATRYFKVFHASQIDGLEAFDADADMPEQPDADDIMEGIDYLTEWANGELASCDYDAHRAAYMPLADHLQMPALDTFHRQSWYGQTLAHEIIHATGSAQRLNRLERTGFGTSTYAKEELVAEFGAAMLCGSLNIPTDMEQSAAYMTGWAKACKEDPSLLVSAANAAETAANYVVENVYAAA